jgi:hypothetical protein
MLKSSDISSDPNFIRHLSDQTEKLMRAFRVPVRDSDPKIQGVLPLIRLGTHFTNKAIFTFTGKYLYRIEEDNKVITGYENPIIWILPETGAVLNKPNASMLRYYQSILVHELVHFWEVRKIPLKGKEYYVDQREDLDGYFLQSSEFNAYKIQALFYFNITSPQELCTSERELINQLFEAGNEPYRYQS